MNNYFRIWRDGGPEGMTFVGEYPADSITDALRRAHFMFYDAKRIEAEPV